MDGSGVVGCQHAFADVEPFVVVHGDAGVLGLDLAVGGEVPFFVFWVQPEAVGFVGQAAGGEDEGSAVVGYYAGNGGVQLALCDVEPGVVVDHQAGVGLVENAVDNVEPVAVVEGESGVVSLDLSVGDEVPGIIPRIQPEAG